MKTVDGKYVCDAEIGRPGTARDSWHGCRRKAVVKIKATTCELHYCTRHRAHADDRTGRNFQRAPFAEAQSIV